MESGGSGAIIEPYTGGMRLIPGPPRWEILPMFTVIVRSFGVEHTYNNLCAQEARLLIDAMLLLACKPRIEAWHGGVLGEQHN